MKSIAQSVGKSVGVRLGSVLNPIRYVKAKSKNLFDVSTIIEGQYVLANGSFATNASFSRSDYIPVLSTTTYTFSGIGTGNKYFAFYKSDHTVTAATTKGGDLSATPTITTPSDCAFIVFITKWVGESFVPMYFQLELGSTATSYEEFHGEYNVLNSQQYPDNFSKIIASGSSRTAGVGASDNSHKWVSLLQTALSAKYGRSITVTNRGLSGLRSSDNLRDLRTQILSVLPDILILEMNVNDATYVNGILTENSIKNYESIINRAFDKNVVTVIWGCAKTVSPQVDWDNSQVDEINLLGKALAVQYNLRFIDADAYFDTHSGLYSDGIHFSDAGNADISNLLLNVI